MYTHIVPPISTPAQFLRAVQKLQIPVSGDVTKELLRRHLVASSGPERLSMGDAETELYRTIISDIGVQLFHQGDEHAPPPVRAIPESILVPQFDTRWCYEDMHGRPGARALDDYVIEVALILGRMGLGRLFARVCVSDDISALADREGLPDAGFDTLMSVCFPVSSGRVEVPLLLIQWTPSRDHLQASLFHEAMHVVVYYLWGLRAPQVGAVFPLYVLVSRLAAEMFVQMQTAAVFGVPYLMGLLVSVPGLTPAGGVQQAASYGPRRHLKPVHGSETEFRQTMLFLETLPWVAVLSDFPSLGHLKSQLMLTWTPKQHATFDQLVGVAKQLFATCDLTTELYGQLLGPLDSAGPCGNEFLTYSANLWAIGSQA